MIAARRLPESLSDDQLRIQAYLALEDTSNDAPISRVVVPGDRVVLACNPAAPGVRTILGVASDLLIKANVESVTWLFPPTEGEAFPAPDGVQVVHHDPSDRESLAYLAATRSGTRVYLNKVLTDADCVIPIGRLSASREGGDRGPWNEIYPQFGDDGQARTGPPSGPDADSEEVAWLLGTIYQIGWLPGRRGVARVVAGISPEFQAEAARLIGSDGRLEADARADLVVAGLGVGTGPLGWDGFVAGLESAMNLVQRAGKIVALGRVDAPLTPALELLASARSPREAKRALSRAETSPADRELALRLLEILDWADVYASGLPGSLGPDDLGMIRLDRPSEAARLASRAHSVTLLSAADLFRAAVLGEGPAARSSPTSQD